MVMATTPAEHSLQEKSNMLDEVNQLLDLMVGEKKMLQKRIEDLETEVTQQKQLAINNDDDKENERIVINDIKQVRVLILKERENIASLSKRTEDAIEMYSRHRDDRNEEIKSLKIELNQYQLTCREQKRQLKKLQDELICNRNNCQQLTLEKDRAISELNKMREKYSKTRTTLLAVKGRTNYELKKCQEQRQEENMKREIEVVKKTEEKLKSQLYTSVRQKDNQVKYLTDQVTSQENEIMNLTAQLKTVKEGVANQLGDLGAELVSSRKELHELKGVLVSQKDELIKTKDSLKHERRQSHLLLTTSQSTLNRLLSQIDKERNEHQKELHTLRVAMATQKQEDKLKLDRLKEVSVKRCGQLAKEVWSLKNNKNQ